MSNVVQATAFTQRVPKPWLLSGRAKPSDSRARPSTQIFLLTRAFFLVAHKVKALLNVISALFSRRALTAPRKPGEARPPTQIFLLTRASRVFARKLKALLNVILRSHFCARKTGLWSSKNKLSYTNIQRCKMNNPISCLSGVKCFVFFQQSQKKASKMRHVCHFLWHWRGSGWG